MKYLLVILLSCMSFFSFSQEINSSYIIERADKMDTIQATIVYVGGLEEPSIVMYGDGQVRALFTFEQVQKMNNKYRIAELLEDVIKKYGIESSIDVGVINGLENEIYLLNEKVDILNGRIVDKDLTIVKLEQTIASLEKKQAISDEASNLADEIIKSKDKEIKKLKRHKVMIAIGSGAIIVLIVLVAL